MTREEFKDGLAIITHPETDLKYFNKWISSITQHDAEQRAEIDRQAQAIRNLETDYILIGTQNREQKDEIARLRGALTEIIEKCEDEDWEYMFGDIMRRAKYALKETP